VKLIVIFLLTIGIMPSIAYSDDKVNVGYVELTKVLDSVHTSSPYNQLMATLFSRIETETNAKINTLYIPSGRLNVLLQNGSVDCIFPVVPNGYDRKMATIFSDGTNNVASFHFYLQNKKKAPLEQGEKEVIVYNRTSYFGKLFEQPHDVKYIAVDSQQIAINLLRKGRADGYLAYYPDIKVSLSEQDFQQLIFDKAKPVTESIDKMECADTEKSQNFLIKFNAELRKMKNSGEIKHILGDYYNL